MRTRFFSALAAFAACLATAGPTRTQHFNLQKGWNAVFIQVEPESTEPGNVFASAPIDVVASFLPTRSSVQFISDPDEEPWNTPGWSVWYAPSRPDSFLSTMGAVIPHRPYLVHATENAEWSVSGTVQFHRHIWQPNGYNFLGFPVDAQAPPTFASLFDNSSHQSVFRLTNGNWVQVTNHTTTAVRSGEAYWVRCDGRSTWQGPLEIEFTGIDGLSFGDSSDTSLLTFRNRSSVPFVVQIELLAEGQGLPLAQVVRHPETLVVSYPDLQRVTVLDDLEPGRSQDLRLHLRREKMTKREQACLLRISAGGIVQILPVTAIRSDLEE
jgi:hypothetical protein